MDFEDAERRYSTSSFALAGACSGLLTAVGLTASGAFAPAAAFFAIIPAALIAWALTKNIHQTVILVWLNEQLFGMGGAWLMLGPIPGRALLLAVLLTATVMSRSVRSSFGEIRLSAQLWILFYGTLLPLIFLAWSLGSGNSLSDSLGDVLRFGAVLAIYPVYTFLVHRPRVFGAWLLGGSFAVTLLFVVMSVASPDLRRLMVDNWVYSGSGLATAADYFRITFEPLFYGYIGLFSALLWYMFREKVTPGSVILFVGALLPAALNFLRGPLVGVFAVISGVLLIQSLTGRGAVRTAKLLPFVVLVSALAVFVIVQNPEAAGRTALFGGGGESSILGAARSAQVSITLNGWLDSPILGHGVGSRIMGYSSSPGASIEFQWGMVLYRMGLVGLLAVCVPLGIIVKDLFVVKRFEARGSDMFALAPFSTGLVLVSIAIASFFNPYLASSMTVTLFVVFFADRLSSRRGLA